MSQPQLPSRYEHRRLLGEGGMGQVHLVHDRVRDAELALKLMLPAALSAEGADDPLFGFQQEYGSMVSLVHPNLVAAYDYGETADGLPFFTMELVPGHDLGEGTRSEDQIRAWLPGVAAALGYLHRRGFVHADLKPENIRIREDGTPKLMDLGLLTRTGRSGGPIKGSVFYMAPEVIRQGAVDGRADLYSLGAILFHLLVGRPPFQNENTLALLRAHLESPPPSLREAGADVSPALEALVGALLAKEPSRRPASVGAVLAALGLPAEAGEAATLLGSDIVGRTTVQARLASLLSTPGESRLCLVGAPGAGKTRLLEDLRGRAQIAGAETVILTGRGADAPPYQALAPLLRALTATPSATRDRLAPVLVKLVPSLGVEPAPALEGSQERARLHGAVAELARERLEAALWLVDDADQLDAASQGLLDALARQAEGRSWHWVYTARAPLAQVAAEALEALSEDDVLTVARALLGQEALPQAVIERLPVLCGGLPGALEAVLAHWVRVGALAYADGHWRVAAEDKLELPGGLEVALEASFQDLSERGRELARVAAVIGGAGELALLSALSGLREAAFFEAFAELETAELLARDDQGFRFVRPVQATALAAGMAESDRRHLHSAAANWLAERAQGQPEDPGVPLGTVLRVARHLLAGETPEAAVAWVKAGATRAITLFALDAAAPLLEAALALPGVAEADRLTLESLQANLLRHQGNSDAAIARFEELDLLARLERAGHPALAADTVVWGVLLMTKGRYEEAIAAQARATEIAAQHQDAPQQVRALRLGARAAYFSGKKPEALALAERGVQIGRGGGAPAQFAPALGWYGYLLTAGGDKVEEGLAMLAEAIGLLREQGNVVELTETLVAQGSAVMALGRHAQALGAFEEALSEASRLGIPVNIMTGHTNLAAVKVELGELPAARDHAATVAAMGEQLGRKFYQLYGQVLGGLVRVFQGETVGGLAQLERAVQLALEMGNKVGELYSRVQRAEALVFAGRGDEAKEELTQARQLAEATHTTEHDAKLARLELLAALHAAMQGAEPPATPVALPQAKDATEALLPRAEALVANARGRDLATLAHALRASALVHLYRGEAETATTAAREARELAGANGLQLLGAELDGMLGWLAQASGQDQARELLSASLAAARTIGARPLACWCEALLATLRADRRGRREAASALKQLADGLDTAGQAAYVSWPGRQAVVSGASGASGAVDAERLRDVLAIASDIDPFAGLGNVVSAALRALVNLTGAERGFLLLYDNAEVSYQAFYGMNATDSDTFSTTLADQVYWSGEPFFIEDAQAHGELAQAKSIQALALRTAFGLPLRFRGEVIGVMLGDSQRVNPDFTPAHVELAQALADQVARSIEIAAELDRADAAQIEAERLQRLALETLGTTDLQAFMAPVAAEALALTGADRCFLVLGSALSCAAAYDREGQPLPAAEQALSSSVCRWVLEQGESLYLADAQESEAFQQQKSVMALALRMVYAVPVAHDGRRVGVLYLHDQHVGREDRAILGTLERIGELVGAFLVRAGLA